MKKIKNYSNLTNFSTVLNVLNAYGAKRALFLDIETTGFSPAKSNLYLIGTAYLENGCLILEQFFADPLIEHEEIRLLTELSDLCRRLDFDTIITFHGTGFDLPFLKSRTELLGLDPDTCSGYNNKYYVDLYKLFSAYRHIFQLQNYKQKTLEAFLGVCREDILTGEDMRKVYKQYRKNPEDTDALERLLLHNREDILGMARLFDLYAYEYLFQGDFQIADFAVSQYRKIDGTDGKELHITCRLSHPVPAAISCNNQYFYLHASGTNAVFCISLYEGTLKYFYPNYKDYYYLPDEDIAVHKSVAAYVDQAHRRKASAAECYSKKTGVFLPQLEAVAAPALFMNYKDRMSYFELPACSDGNTAYKEYCMHILNVLKAGKS